MSQFQRAPRNFRRVCNITLVNGSDLLVSRIFYSPTSAPAPKDPHQSNRQYRGNNVSEIWSPHKTPTRTFFICTLNTHQCFHTLSAVRLWITWRVFTAVSMILLCRHRYHYQSFCAVVVFLTLTCCLDPPALLWLQAVQLSLLPVYVVPVPGHGLHEHPQDVVHRRRQPLADEHPQGLHLCLRAAQRRGRREEHLLLCRHVCF